MPRYLVTLRNGHKMMIDADSAEQAKSITRERLNSMRAHARSKPAKDEYTELAQTSSMHADRQV